MKNLKKIREERKLTQQNVADLLNIQRPTYTRYETGEREPDFETLIKLSEILEVSVDYLLGKTEYPTKVDEELAGEKFALWGEVHDLSQEEKEKVLEFIKFTKSQRNNK